MNNVTNPCTNQARCGLTLWMRHETKAHAVKPATVISVQSKLMRLQISTSFLFLLKQHIYIYSIVSTQFRYIFQIAAVQTMTIMSIIIIIQRISAIIYVPISFFSLAEMCGVRA